MTLEEAKRVPTPPYVPLPLSLPRFSRKLDCRRLGLGLAIRFHAQARLHPSITCALRRIPPGVLSHLKSFRTTVPTSQQPNARMPMATSAITTLYVSHLSPLSFLSSPLDNRLCRKPESLRTPILITVLPIQLSAAREHLRGDVGTTWWLFSRRSARQRRGS